MARWLLAPRRRVDTPQARIGEHLGQSAADRVPTGLHPSMQNALKRTLDEPGCE